MRRLLLLLGCAGAGIAAEAGRRDLLLAVEAGDGAFDYRLGTPIGGFDGSDAFDRITVLRLGGRWSLGAPGSATAVLVGLDGERLDAPLAGGGLTAWSAGASLGATWALAPALAGDIEGFASGGPASLDVPVAGAPLAGDGTVWRVGGRLRALWHPHRHWSLVAEAGWQTWSASISADQRDLTLSGAGPLVALGVAWRPSARPAGVE
jgi:hypothetical protein